MLQVPCDHDRLYKFEPQRTALLVIDMQRDFIDPCGGSGVAENNVSFGQAIVPHVKAVLNAARAMRMMVVHTREGHEPDLSDLHAFKRNRSAESGMTIGEPTQYGRFLVRGEYGHDFVDELKPIEGELVIDKPGFGAFYATDLGERLRIREITHLLITGVTTQCCVFSTLREAVDRGYWCLTLRDCTAAFEPYLHEATMRMIASEDHLFGWISTSIAFLNATGQPVPSAPAPGSPGERTQYGG